MKKTLKDLLTEVKSLIKEQGEDSVVSYWIYTKKDVMGIEIYDEEGNPTIHYPENLANEVIAKLQNYRTISDHISDCIDMEIGYQTEDNEEIAE